MNTDADQPRAFLATIPKLSYLLIFLPVVIVLKIAHADPIAIFICSGIAILGTVTLIGKATEEIAVYAGPLWGGLLNATFGNITELIIAMFGLVAGPTMYPVVLASITGSILGNLLLVLGAAMLYGGTKYQTQSFSRTGAHVNVGMLWVTLIMLSVPTVITLLPQVDPVFVEHPEWASTFVQESSLTAAILLLILYGLTLVFSLRTHRFLLRPDVEHHETAEWSKELSAGILLGATLCVAFLSESFVGAIEHMREAGTLQMSELFIGVIIVAVVGNAAEGMVAVWVARDNKMELSFQIAMGSCLQVALLVAPVLVIASYFLASEPMSLTFSLFEIASLGAAVLVSSAALNDGESNWIEGAMFLAVYLFFAVVFWFHP
ncbi:calcium/proton exchanger [Stratiformator vulcanicus]|uniref:Ca(2+)/H(+) antiporter n=1 Tax=Stratiformator vulcanicus TaxID=2527980 RepID=A0A517QW71_9PLAN|nr:calcium/proton exchanger [Stratiformator vulcanicus]QDT35837.1 Putative cation exchanger YfkE [Stratiformator vulcanicus]